MQSTEDTTTDSLEDTTLDPVPDAPVESECTVDLDCDDDDPCTADSCDTDFGECRHDVVDEDEDGYAASTVGGVDCWGDDCDDTRDTVHPGVTVTECSYEDMDCSGQPDWDEDGDGYQSLALCSSHGTDCDDFDKDTWPGAEETCEPDIDRDCNGEPDLDNDGDEYQDADCPGGDDCNDLEATIHPGASEICLDGIDQDCDDVVDGPAMRGAAIKQTNGHVACEHPVIASGSGGTSSGFTVACSEEIASGTSQIKYVATDSSWFYGVLDVTSDHGAMTATPDFCTNYHMAWVDERDGNREIYFGRYSVMTLPGVSNVRITNAAYNSIMPALARISSTGDVGLVWSDSRGENPEIYYARLDDGGGRITSDIRITDTSSQSIDPSIVWSGSEFGLAWRESMNSIYFTRIATDGARTASDVLVYSGSTYDEKSPALQWTGSQYGLAWVRYDSFSSGLVPVPISFAVISSTGVVESLQEYPVQATAPPALAWTGSEYGLAYASDGDVFLDRVAIDGTLIGTPAVHTAGGNILDVDIAWNEGDELFGVTWNSDEDGDLEV